MISVRTALVLMLAHVAAWAPAPSNAAPDDDAGALGLQAEPEPAAASSPTRLFVEGAVGQADRRYGLGSRAVGRAAVDLRTSFKPGSGMHAAFSGRLDATDPADPRIDNPIASLRELYGGWQNEAATYVVDLGRINVRQGPGYGYNPTDFFRDNALRTITTADPFLLRENRLGSVMLRAQRLWSSASVEAIYAPALADHPSTRSVSLDLGATNARDRGLLALNTRWSETVNTQLSLYKEAGTSWRLGVSGTALISSAIVAHGEFSSSREPDLLSRVGGQSTPQGRHQRVAAGLTYTTTGRLSATVEYQANGFGLDRDGQRAITAAGPQAWSAYYLQALALQDLAARRAWLLYAVQRDLGVKNLDLTLILRRNSTDRSVMTWVDLKYRLDKLDLALQLQRNSGELGSEFGSATYRHLVSLVATAYF